MTEKQFRNLKQGDRFSHKNGGVVWTVKGAIYLTASLLPDEPGKRYDAAFGLSDAKDYKLVGGTTDEGTAA